MNSSEKENSTMSNAVDSAKAAAQDAAEAVKAKGDQVRDSLADTQTFKKFVDSDDADSGSKSKTVIYAAAGGAVVVAGLLAWFIAN